MNSITITLPLPARELSPNARVYWAKKSGITKRHRIQAHSCVWLLMAGDSPPRWKKAKVALKFYFKNKRHPDPDNTISSMKAYFDGIADAGVVENDRGLWPERPEFFTDKANPRVELTITKED